MMKCITTAAIKPRINNVKNSGKFIPIISSLLVQASGTRSGRLVRIHTNLDARDVAGAALVVRGRDGGDRVNNLKVRIADFKCM